MTRRQGQPSPRHPGRRRELEEDVFLRHTHLGEAHGAGWWEQSGDRRVEFIGHNRL
jgi:hypothetical protein